MLSGRQSLIFAIGCDLPRQDLAALSMSNLLLWSGHRFEATQGSHANLPDVQNPFAEAANCQSNWAVGLDFSWFCSVVVIFSGR